MTPSRIGQSELAVARLSLGAAVDDPAANAAAICPHVRSFLAAFGATPELHALGLDPQIVPHLERLDSLRDIIGLVLCGEWLKTYPRLSIPCKSTEPKGDIYRGISILPTNGILTAKVRKPHRWTFTRCGRSRHFSSSDP
jgi:hypothetical protein